MKEAYYSILIHKNYQKYLELFWKEEHYQYIVLPNGFPPAGNIRATVALLRELGFTIHPEKSVLVPTQQIIFLGFVIDSVKMTIAPTEERK